MQTYEILVRNRAVVGNSRDMTLVRTSVGIDRVHILFDNAEWLDFPITITFAQGDDMLTETLVVTRVDSSDWVAEATCLIPWEVIDSTGPIRVTFQGTDASGRHIITAKGAPLAVEEAGDVVIGDVPEDAPTVDQWHQAYADAMAAVNEAASLVATLQARIDEIVADAESSISGYELPVATSDVLGGVKVGDNLTIDSGGLLSAEIPEQRAGLSDDQATLLRNLQRLAAYAFDTEFIGGDLQDTVTLKPSSMPVAKFMSIGGVRVDDDTIKVTSDGLISSPRYVLPTATADTLGGVMPDGVTISNDEGAISVPIADPATLGVVRPDGVTITVDENGVITSSGSGGDGGYVLPVASTTQLGGVKVDGETIGIRDGTISLLLKDASAEVY